MKEFVIKRFLRLCVFLVLAPSFTVSQELTIKPDSLREIPTALQPSLIDRLREFILTQKNDQWDQVSVLLGDIRMDAYKPRRYTSKHKQCLIEQMKSFRMTRFTVTSLAFSSGAAHTPIDRKWWFVIGDAEFAGELGPSSGPVWIMAYRHMNNWYFTPPSYDEAWVRSTITEQELQADQSKHLTIQLEPTCPLEIIDLSVRIDPHVPSSRMVHFSFHNKSKQTVTGLSFEIKDTRGNGSVSVGMPIYIGPGGTAPAPKNLSYTAYQYYCEGESQQSMSINSVDFKDGIEWKPPRRYK